MLVIRLARTGKKKQAYFRIVVAEKQKAVGAKFVEILGNYNPHEKKIVINKEKLEQYLKNGAQPSNTLAKVLKKEGITLPKWVKIVEKNKAPKSKEEDKKEAPKKEEASTETVEESTDVSKEVEKEPEEKKEEVKEDK